ncbi:LOW QUALITY PROTEIN: fibulin-7-like [Lates calcarifer]|uniref:LOW QUALITY PROTEIN: fibulin-7-like n=1 Tax=Lates calcarifer TaxID=8187 RepID=A0AAJ7L949_LATCA|nr:LOW QUALITY PROTEIN: fibulin-7-like [Lates calcarifer]
MRMEVLSRMEAAGVVVLMLSLHHMCLSSAQDCPSTHDLLNSLRQVEKMLVVHEASYQQGLRSLRKKISALHNSTMAIFKAGKNVSCPKPELPAHGRRLGRVFGVGHEVHFLCKPGYELIGPRTRVCLESLKWSGQQPMCRRFNSTENSLASFSPAAPSSSSSSSPFPGSAALSASSSSSSSSSASYTLSSSSPTSSPPSSVRPSHCTHFLGSTRCTCDVGFTISGRDNNICTDIDECRLFPLGQPGRLCVHQCVNTPGSFHCFCPAGYDLARDGRSCTDMDECENRMHNCTSNQVCVNTYGGFQCVTVECPHMKNATYIKTSPMRCERNPCMLGDKACTQAPNSISFHFLSVVSNMSAPRVLFRVSAARVLGDTLRFGLAGGRGRGHFSVQRSGRQTGTLLLVTPIKGPATLEAEVEMSELERNALLGRYLTKVTLFVSPYEF